MSRFVWTALLLLLGAAGCWPQSPLLSLRVQGEKGTLDSHVTKSPLIPKMVAPVTPAQVTKENARDMSTALWDEMDRAEQCDLLPEIKSPMPKKK